jgi:hypothetical protein
MRTLVVIALTCIAASAANAQFVPKRIPGTPNNDAAQAASIACQDACLKEFQACVEKIRTEDKTRCEVKVDACRATCSPPERKGQQP